MFADPNIPQGQLQMLRISSRALSHNMLGDPDTRDVALYLPAGHEGRGLPLLVDLAGYTGSGLGHAAWRGFGETLPQRLDRLIHQGALPPVVVAMPDCFTRLGGNQYVNSSAMGNWENFLAQDMLTEIETRIGCGGPGRRALFGKSSGGYGAFVNALKHPEIWSAAACMSGDMAFELCYLPDMPATLRALAKDGGITGFMNRFESALKTDGKDIHPLMILAMAATYDPDPDAPLGIRLPVDPHSCEIIPERWEAWLAWGPLRLIEQQGDALKGLKTLWIECGDIDQYNLLYGARRMTRRLTELGIAHHYEEFPDTHSSLDYRLDTVLPHLAQALS